MHARLTTTLLLCFVLSACSNITQTADQAKKALDDVVLTASGRIQEVRLRGEAAIQPIVETVNDVNRRVDDVQKGIEKAKEAKELLNSAID